MKFKDFLSESLNIKQIRILLNNKKDLKYDEKYNSVTSDLALRDLLSKVQKILKVKFKKEAPEETENDIYSIGDIEILASETGKTSKLTFIKGK